jgi:hypothetical protein
MKVKNKFICQHCKDESEIDIYPVINLQSDTNIVNDLFSLDLFRVECPKCKKITLVQYDTIVVDMYKKYIVYLYNDTANGDLNKDSVVNSLRQLPEFKSIFDDVKYTRIVSSANELLEKLLIYDYDLNDKIVELLKLSIKNSKAEEFEKYPNICFDKLDRTSLVFTCFNLINKDVTPVGIGIEIQYYNDIIDTLGKLPEETELFSKIDEDWAKNILMSLQNNPK